MAKDPEVGDYVLATRWGDGDPGDPWYVGFYAGKSPGGKHAVTNNEGVTTPFKYTRVGRIRQDVGKWLVDASPTLEQAPGGTVNMWSMLGFNDKTEACK